MIAATTPDRYGTISRIFHWLTALLILTAIPLGMLGESLAEVLNDRSGLADQDLIARTTLVFSLHKTVGVMAFLTGVLRIVWALMNPKPGLLNGDHRTEALLAEAVHWLLYLSMVIVPLSGWIMHAASEGFAPILWPFGQGLPMVPKSPEVKELAKAIHLMTKNILIFAILLHVAGALKHHFIDRDATLRRMAHGIAATPTASQPGHFLPAMIAAGIFLVAVLATLIFGGDDREAGSAEAAPAPTVAVQLGAGEDISGQLWAVDTGQIGLTIRQMGSEISGEFTDWSADIRYAPGQDGPRGAVAVVIRIPGLSLGSVTAQAMGADFFDADAHPATTLSATLEQSDGALTAQGTLEIRGQSVPVSFPVALTLDGDRAQASGTLTLDRRDWSIGSGVTDPDTLGFEVAIRFELSAHKVASDT